jgi:hypothetical protein
LQQENWDQNNELCHWNFKTAAIIFIFGSEFKSSCSGDKSTVKASKVKLFETGDFGKILPQLIKMMNIIIIKI